MNYAAFITVIAIACSFYLGHIENESQATAFGLMANIWAAAYWVNARHNT